MKTLSILAILTITGCLLAACSAPPSPTIIPTEDVVVRADDPSGGRGNKAVAPDPIYKARTLLAEQVGKQASSIIIRTFFIAEWPDSCLGLGGSGEICLPVKTLGYQVELVADGRTYVYRTDMNGRNARYVTDDRQPAAVKAARQTLADLLKIASKDIVVVSYTLDDFADSCLGVGQAGEMCLQVITRGYVVVLQAGGQSYTYHTDQLGKSIRLKTDQQPTANPSKQAPVGTASQGVVIYFRRVGGIAGFCDELTVTAAGEVMALSCRTSPAKEEGATRLTDAELLQLASWAEELSAFDFAQSDPAAADGMSLSLTFSGAGGKPATDQEKNAMLTLAGDLFQRITGR